MVQVTANIERFDEELFGKITNIFDERAKRRVLSDVGFKLFGSEMTNLRTQRYQSLVTGGGLKPVAEGQDFPESTINQGYYKTYTQIHLADGITITKDHYLFFSERYNEIMKMPENLVRTAFDRIDQSLADALNNGWATSYTNVFGITEDGTTPDGVAFFSDSHKVGASSLYTFGNIIYDGGVTGSGTVNPVLSRAALVAARVMGDNFKDSNGVRSPLNFTKLVVSSKDYDLAVQLVKSEYVAGATNAGENGTNMTLNDLEVVKRPRLTGGYWFLMTDQASEAITPSFAQKPQLQAPVVIPKSLSRRSPCDVYYVIKRMDAAQVFGSKGTGSA